MDENQNASNKFRAQEREKKQHRNIILSLYFTCTILSSSELRGNALFSLETQEDPIPPNFRHLIKAPKWGNLSLPLQWAGHPKGESEPLKSELLSGEALSLLGRPREPEASKVSKRYLREETQVEQ